MGEPSTFTDTILKELAYYKKQLDRIAGESVRNDFTLSSLRHELKQKKEAFTILTNLQKDFTVSTPLHVIFERTAKAINTHLEMDRTIVFLPGSRSNVFKAAYWYGVDEEQVPILEMREVDLHESVLESCKSILQNRSTEPDEINRSFQKIFGYSFFYRSADPL